MPPIRRRRANPRHRRRSQHKGSSTIAAAWRRYNARRKARQGVTTRTAQQNYKEIKKLKVAPTLKWANNAVASLRTNWCGQQLSNEKVNNMGYSFDYQDYVAATPGNPLPQAAFSPLVLQPWVIEQGEGEAERIGNSIKHSHTILKFTMAGENAQLNTGIFADVPQKQTCRFYVVLDNQPGKEPVSLGTTAPVFEPLSIPARLFPPITDDNLVSSGASGPSNMPGNDYLRIGPKIGTPNTALPAGLATGNVGVKDLDSLSFYSRDFVSSDNPRFKVLKVVTLTCSQPQNPSAALSAPRKTEASKTVTIKVPWKLHFDGDKNLIPSSRNLLVFCASDCAVNATSASIGVDNVAAPTISMLSRTLFRG